MTINSIDKTLDLGEFNRLTLRFKDQQLENKYQQKTEHFRHLQLRWAVLVVGFLYLLFSLADNFILSGELRSFASLIHLIQGISLCLAIAISYRIKSTTFLYSTVFIANVTTWTSHLVIVITSHSSIYFAEAYFMLLWVWVASGFSITLSFKYNIIFIILFELVMQNFGSFTTEQMTIHHLFIFVSIVLGGFGGYLVEYHKRQSFLSFEITAHAKLQAEQANSAKDMFLSIISHDLRSPIGSISLILNDVAKSGADLTDEIFSVLCRASKNTELLLENLLSWAISHNGEIVSKPTNFPIIESVQHSMELLQSSARQKNIELTMDIAPTLYVYADVEMLNTIIRNLLNNAIKYTRSNGNVMIAAHENQGMLNLIVTDNGVGIADEIQQNLFNPGNKVHTSLGTADERGTGMGLALCAEFIKINRGSISVESHQGKGSEFICTLPLGVATATPQVDIALLKDWMVLVVEDNPLHQTSTRQALQSIGLEAIIACNGNEAVNIALRDKPKLVFMDFDLPDTTGDLIALQIREQSINPPGMIIALTSYSKAEFEKKSTKSQFDGCLRKPLKSSELLACIVPLILSSNDSRIQLANTTDGLMPKNT